MPIREYTCDKCGETIEVLHVPGETEELDEFEECPLCLQAGEEYPGTLEPRMSAPHIKVKGYNAQNGYSVTHRGYQRVRKGAEASERWTV